MENNTILNGSINEKAIEKVLETIENLLITYFYYGKDDVRSAIEKINDQIDFMAIDRWISRYSQKIKESVSTSSMYSRNEPVNMIRIICNSTGTIDITIHGKIVASTDFEIDDYIDNDLD